MAQTPVPMDIDSPVAQSPPKNSVAPDIQKKFTQNVHRYFKQLSAGCGRKRCSNKYCASNPDAPRLNPNEAAAMALRLATGSELHFCEPLKPHMTLEEFKHLMAEYEEKHDATALIRTIGIIFSAPESLNLSFAKSEQATKDSPNIDLEALAYFYQQVQRLDGVKNALMSAYERLVANLRIGASRLGESDLTDLRLFITVLSNPALMDVEYHKNVLTPLCFALAQLTPSARTVLVVWFSRLPPEITRQVLQVIQQFISLRLITSNAEEADLHKDKPIINATKALSIIHKANAKAGEPLKFDEFYNDLINERLDLREDFVRWKNNANFCFIDYSFVLDPGTKSKVLQFESAVQQNQQRQEALRTLFMGNMGAVPVLVFRIRREHLIEDTLAHISRRISDPSELKKELKVHFEGEEAIDEGGVQKEYFQLIVREIFDAKYGMFIHNDKTRTYWFNSFSYDWIEFELIGAILGLAIYNGVILDVHFPFVVYKKLMGMQPTLDDLNDVNPELCRGLKQLLEFEGDVEMTFCRTFQITQDFFGEMKTVDLKPGGADIPLTNENRREYVDLYVRFLLDNSVGRQFDSFLKGFRRLCDTPAFSLFRAEELELLICGSPELEFEELEKVAIYENGYSSEHPTIKHFWAVVHSLTPEEKKKLLFFATGSDRAPIGGLSKLHFVITRHGPDDARLPQAHTCFNHLLLPEYRTKEKLLQQLHTAINNAEGFGMR